MSDKTENIGSALAYTRKAMREIDDVTCTRMRKHTLSNLDFELLNGVYTTLKQAEQKITELKV